MYSLGRKQIFLLIFSIQLLSGAIAGLSEMVKRYRFTKLQKNGVITGEVGIMLNTTVYLESATRCGDDELCIGYQCGKHGSNNCKIIYTNPTQGEEFVSTDQITVYMKKDSCKNNSCQNGGTCLNGVDSYTCSCVAGYNGDNCESNIDECTGSPCQNGGACMDGVNTYTCNCVAGYDGINCETNIDNCAASPCQNGGTCVDGLGSYTCDCPNCYSGNNCETECSPPWEPPGNWPMRDQPVVYRNFESTNCMQISGIVHNEGVKEQGIATNRTNKDYVNLGDLSRYACFTDLWNCTGRAALSVWIKLLDTPHNTGIMTSTSFSSTGFRLHYWRSKLRCRMLVNGGYFEATFNPVVGWFHLVVNYLGPNNGQGLVVYVNGTKVKKGVTRYVSVHNQGKGQLILGKKYIIFNNYYSSLAVDELTLWNRQLIALEIEDLYEMFP